MVGGREHRVSGAQRLPGEDPWVPDRVGRDRSAAAGACGSRGSVGGGAGGRAWGQAAGGLLHGKSKRRWRRRWRGSERGRVEGARGGEAAGVHGASWVGAVGGVAADGEREAGPEGVAGTCGALLCG